MRKNQRRLRKIEAFVMIGTSMVAAFLLLALYYDNHKESPAAEAEVNFSEQVGKAILEYGANENGNWEAFAANPEPRMLHSQAGSRWIRVWAASPAWRKSTVPLKDGYYDYRELDMFINAVLQTGAKPFIVFAHAPGQVGQAHGEPPPGSDEWFAGYVQNVVMHYDEMCRTNGLAAPCSIAEWQFEIWNEPFTDEWWDESTPRYVRLYNTVYWKIKSVAPAARVGGYTMSLASAKDEERLRIFLSQCQTDFVSIHHYGNSLNYRAGESEKMSATKELFYDRIMMLRSLIEKEQPGADVDIVVSEYAPDYRSSYMPRLDEEFTAAWLASALVWQVQSREVSLEMYYSGTSVMPDGGFGMWGQDADGSFVVWPSYYVKRAFAAHNPTGSAIYETNFDSASVDLLATCRDRCSLTVVNKEDRKKTLAISIAQAPSGTAVDSSTMQRLAVRNSVLLLHLEPYQARFLRFA